ncbi:hypothetical protein FRC14_004727 [Serendipita sp. 396]|nr:hypothetical protein FRC14_004727 [Serendipita sp. 396]
MGRKAKVGKGSSFFSSWVCTILLHFSRKMANSFQGPTADLARMIPYEELNALQNRSVKYGMNIILTSVSRASLPAELAKKIYDNLVETARNPTSNCHGVVMGFLWEYHNLAVQSRVAADSTAFRMRYPIPAATLIISWDDSIDDPAATAEARARLKEMKVKADQLLRDTFKGQVRREDDTGYGNYEPSDSRSIDAAATLFGSNYSRLQSIKGVYDAKQLFCSWYPIRPQ